MDCESHLRDHGRTTVVWRAPQVTLLILLEENEKGFKQLDVDRIKEDYCAENSSYPCGICSTCSLCLRTCDRQLLKSLSIIRSSCVRDVIAPTVVHNLMERRTIFVDLFLSRQSYWTIQQDVQEAHQWCIVLTLSSSFMLPPSPCASMAVVKHGVDYGQSFHKVTMSLAAGLMNSMKIWTQFRIIHRHLCAIPKVCVSPSIIVRNQLLIWRLSWIYFAWTTYRMWRSPVISKWWIY